MRFKISYNWYRFMGITGLFLIGYIVVIGIFGNVDITPVLPMQLATALETHWPDLPFFQVEKDAVNDGNGQETYYTVPTRQLTPQEIAKLKATGPPPKSVPIAPANTAVKKAD